MLLRIFRGTGPGVILLIVVTLLLVWISPFVELQGRFSLYFDLDPMPLYGILSYFIGTNPLPGIIFTLALVSLISILLVNLNTALFFINERTFLPAVMYILLSGLFPQYQLMNPALFSGIFLMLAIRRITDAYRVQGIAYNFFDAGFLIGTGSLFYANLIWLGLLIIIGIALLRTMNLKEIAISVLGLATPFILTFGIYYVAGKDLKDLWSLLGYNLFSKTASYAFSQLTVVTLILIGLTTLVSVAYLLRVMDTKKIKSRKTFYLLLWAFIISISIFFAFSSVSVEIVWLAGIPLSYILSHYFVFVKKKLIPEILFSLFFVLIALIQIWYMK